MRQARGTGNGSAELRLVELRLRRPAVPSRLAAVSAVEPGDLPLMRHFKDVGWVAVQRQLDDPTSICSSSPRPATLRIDQPQPWRPGCLPAVRPRRGAAIQSGYYVGFNTSMHRQWRRLTKSKNAILIDGCGQYAGADKSRQIQSVGKVLEAREQDDGTVFISLDPTQAYRHEVPYLRSYRRDFHLIRGRHLVVVDEVELDQEGDIQWLMRLMAAPRLGQSSFRYDGQRGGITGSSSSHLRTGQPVHWSHGDVDPAEIEASPRHHRVIATTPRARAHTWSRCSPPSSRPRRAAAHFIDDQGFAVHVCFPGCPRTKATPSRCRSASERSMRRCQTTLRRLRCRRSTTPGAATGVQPVGGECGDGGEQRMAAPLRALDAGHAAWSVGVLLALLFRLPVLTAMAAGRLADRRGLSPPLRLAVALTVCGAALWPWQPAGCRVITGSSVCCAWQPPPRAPGQTSAASPPKRTGGSLQSIRPRGCGSSAWLGMAPAFCQCGGAGCWRGSMSAATHGPTPR